MKIKFYPVDINYIVRDGKPIIQIFGLDSLQKKSICIIDNKFVPYFYAKINNREDLGGLGDLGTLGELEDSNGINIEDCKILNILDEERKINEKEEVVSKISVNLPKNVPILSKDLKAKGIDCYETDILFGRRYLIDKKIKPFIEYEAEVEEIQHNAKVKTYKLINGYERCKRSLDDARILAFDIETYNPEGKNIDAKKHPIITIGLYGKNISKVLTWKKFSGNKNYEVMQDEADMLMRFAEIIDEYKPTVIVGYFSDGFDFPYIQERAKKNKVKMNVGLDNSELQILGRTRKEAKITGIVHIDIFKFVRRILGRTLKTDIFTLDAVSEELLGENKHSVDLEGLASAWDEGAKKMEEYAEYNLQDAKLTYDLCVKLWPSILELVKIIGLTAYDVNRMSYSQLVEWYLLRKSSQAGYMIENKPSRREELSRMHDKVEGAFVYEPKPGIYQDIVVFDYRSLYPSIIASLNISKGTLNCKCCKDADKIKTRRGEFWFCKKRKGLFSTVIEELILHRAEVKKEYKKTKDIMLKGRIEALKLLANSFYGYLGFAPARWYCKECSESITAWARHYIHQTIDAAEKEGYGVLYSDTDSVFLLMGEKKIEEVKDFVSRINKNLPGLMELEYEGFYPTGLFVSTKTSETGAKKKYALLDDKGGIIIKGFETVRRNWSYIAKEMQKKIIEILLKERDVDKAKKYVRRVVQDLRENKIPLEKLVIRTQLTKEISDYASIGPHVAAAKRLKELGKPPKPGQIISYVVVKGDGKIRDKVKLDTEAKQDEYDSEYYINHQIIPGIERIFAVFHVDYEELTAETTQAGLDKFF